MHNLKHSFKDLVADGKVTIIKRADDPDVFTFEYARVDSVYGGSTEPDVRVERLSSLETSAKNIEEELTQVKEMIQELKKL